MSINLPKMDLSWIPIKQSCEVCGDESNIRDGKRFCSNKCRQKWNYQNNPKIREKQIARSRKRVEEMREIDRVKKKKSIINKLIEESKQVKIDNDLIDLYKKIYGK